MKSLTSVWWQMSPYYPSCILQPSFYMDSQCGYQVYSTSTSYEEPQKRKANAMSCCLFLSWKDQFVFTLIFCLSVLLLSQFCQNVFYFYSVAKEMRPASSKVKNNEMSLDDFYNILWGTLDEIVYYDLVENFVYFHSK
jgi:hypothetical protein